MRKKLPDLSIQKGLALYLAALLLLVPIRLLAAIFVAALFHELCHVVALLCLGHPVQSILIGTNGARIHTEPLPAFHEMICALAGPFGALLLVPFARWVPTVAVCAAVQSLYNLLPIYPADGGRAVRCGISLLGLGDRVFRILEIFTLAGLLALGIWGTFRLCLGLLPLGTSLCLVIPGIRKK